jgi:hypothetical protein
MCHQIYEAKVLLHALYHTEPRTKSLPSGWSLEQYINDLTECGLLWEAVAVIEANEFAQPRSTVLRCLGRMMALITHDQFDPSQVGLDHETIQLLQAEILLIQGLIEFDAAMRNPVGPSHQGRLLPLEECISRMISLDEDCKGCPKQCIDLAILRAAKETLIIMYSGLPLDERLSKPEWQMDDLISHADSIGYTKASMAATYLRNLSLAGVRRQSRAGQFRAGQSRAGQSDRFASHLGPFLDPIDFKE